MKKWGVFAVVLAIPILLGALVYSRNEARKCRRELEACHQDLGDPGPGPIIIVRPKLQQLSEWKVGPTTLSASSPDNRGQPGIVDVAAFGEISKFEADFSGDGTKNLKRLDLWIEYSGTVRKISAVRDTTANPHQIFWLINDAAVNLCDMDGTDPTWPDCQGLGLPPEFLGTIRDVQVIDQSDTSWVATDTDSDGTKDLSPIIEMRGKAKR